MEVKARISDIGRRRLSFDTYDDFDVEAMQDKDVRLTVKEWREKRSLDANAYFWVLVTKLAGVTRRTNTSVHNRMIADYGEIDMTIKTIILADDIDWQELPWIHLKPTSATRVLDDGKLYRVYLVMRGSHTYNTKEMSRLIDGVVDECKQVGIETMTPGELKRMVNAWKAS